MAAHVGYRAAGLLPAISPEDPSMMRYRTGVFGSFLCAKHADHSPVRFQSKKELLRAQQQDMPGSKPDGAL